MDTTTIKSPAVGQHVRIYSDPSCNDEYIVGGGTVTGYDEFYVWYEQTTVHRYSEADEDGYMRRVTDTYVTVQRVSRVSHWFTA